jgi:hypothetical protein
VPYGSGGVGVGYGDADVQGRTHMVDLVGGEVSTITKACKSPGQTMEDSSLVRLCSRGLHFQPKFELVMRLRGRVRGARSVWVGF